MKKLNTKIFIEKAKIIHGNKYDYSKTEYINSRTKVCIICPKHGEFWQNANSHLQGNGCEKCGNKNKGSKKKLSKEEFILRAREMHGWKYDYSKVEYVNSKTPVCIICPEHGEFWQSPSMHLQGQGCRKCYGNYKSNTEEFIEKARKVHEDKYNYSKVEYVGNKNYVCIICPIHGEFWQRPNDHLNGRGCAKCKYENDKIKKSLTYNEFIKKANLKHNCLYDYSKVKYKNNKTEVCIICHERDKNGIEHGEFWQRPDNHINGQQCPKCARKMSKLEKKVRDFLNERNVTFQQEKKFSWLENLRLDFYLPDYNIAIECQGEQHFIPIDFAGKGEEWAKCQLLENIKRDEQKEELCEKNGIKIIYYTSKKLKKTFNLDYICDLRKINTILNKNKNE